MKVYFEDILDSFGNALVEGIKDGQAGVINAAVETAVKAYKEACLAFGISSPSKLMFELERD